MAESPYILSRREAGILEQVRRRVRELQSRMDRGSASVLQSGPQWSEFEIAAIHADYLDCQRVSSESGGLLTPTISVAKPPSLRQSVFDGQTITYSDNRTFSYSYTSSRRRTVTRTSDSETEEQVVTPDYYVGETVLAVRIQTRATNAGGKLIRWQDVNTAARAWATISEAEA